MRIDKLARARVAEATVRIVDLCRIENSQYVDDYVSIPRFDWTPPLAEFLVFTRAFRRV